MTETEDPPGTSNGSTVNLIDACASYSDDPVVRNAVDVATAELVDLLELVGLCEIAHECPCGGCSGDRWVHVPRS